MSKKHQQFRKTNSKTMSTPKNSDIQLSNRKKKIPTSEKQQKKNITKAKRRKNVHHFRKAVEKKSRIKRHLEAIKKNCY